ncbi:hypothetical protein MOB65_20425 [Bacillus inaquosorum]|uniref:hypothetical protein n=1 Tax=Bacillus inaquosorum TaxID=483913 RepID=UPI002280157D|nr:hypothetical protein [Bacillus inaquosorum]MCY7911225.1 hypothetical protein [Bacillus inaquosorum]
MITVSMDKIVTIIKDLANGTTEIATHNYKSLPDQLEGINEITVKYPFGMKKRRIKNLEDLGFTFKRTIYYNDSEPHSKIKEVWVR